MRTVSASPVSIKLERYLLSLEEANWSISGELIHSSKERNVSILTIVDHMCSLKFRSLRRHAISYDLVL